MGGGKLSAETRRVMVRFGVRQGLALSVAAAALAGCARPGTVGGPDASAVPPGASVITVYDPRTNEPVRRFVVAGAPRGAAVPPAVLAPPPEEVPGAVPGGGKGSGGASGRPRSSGSGFYVSARGVVTNAHVVSGCSALADERGGRFVVRAADPARDLALLEGQSAGRSFLRFGSGATTTLGESVVVLGYPYAGSPLATGLNLTAGIVSAQSGIGGSASHFQITAPVQPGNSGGPVLDDSGGVIGVVRARANDLSVLRATGALPQNINFAIRGESVETFLREHGVTPARAEGARGQSVSAVAAGAQDAVVSVRCFG